ncbi:hypothetical protein MKW98_001589 [Papaver atlanticum]|uniref:Uncharacterized protein n=1 Tax=Papaver atlanticum TaxID=357466 RepID=A0AAD4S869_9MAGN|nr:hypothetical protein MKW98_001589 [Papaver atlanticum]
MFQASQAIETEGTRGSVAGRGGKTFPNQPFQSLAQSLQFPLTGPPKMFLHIKWKVWMMPMRNLISESMM